MSLVLQALNLVITAFIKYQSIGVVIFILVTELVPTGFLLNLYQPKSGFVKSKNANKTKSTTGSTAPKGEIKLKTRAMPSLSDTTLTHT